MANDLPLALIEKREKKQIVQKQKEDWDEITIRSISKILDATEVNNNIFFFVGYPCKLYQVVTRRIVIWGELPSGLV